MSRCTGLKRDLRIDNNETYANYYYLNFRSFLGKKGDSYDRYLIRMCEMGESVNIISQILKKLHSTKIQNKNSVVSKQKLLKLLGKQYWNNSNKKNEYVTMEKLILHFKY
jgi:NADH-quinone oxidoreductase subunit D